MSRNELIEHYAVISEAQRAMRKKKIAYASGLSIDEINQIECNVRETMKADKRKNKKKKKNAGYKGMKMVKLQSLCRSNTLSANGSKQELVDRLNNNANMNMNTNSYDRSVISVANSVHKDEEEHKEDIV